VATEALRSMFAEFGFSFDEKKLTEANRAVDATIAKFKGAGDALDTKTVPAIKSAAKEIATAAEGMKKAAAGAASRAPRGSRSSGWRPSRGARSSSTPTSKRSPGTRRRARSRPSARGSTSGRSRSSRRSATASCRGHAHLPAARGADVAFNITGAQVGRALAAGAAVGVAALVAATHAAFAFADGFSEAGNRVADTASRLGTSTDELQELEHAAGRVNVNADALGQGLAQLSRQADAARTGNEGAAAAFRSLGIRATEADGSTRPVADLMDDLADGFEHVSDNGHRVTLATQLFGDAGTRLLPILRRGRGGIADLRQEFRSLGGGISRDGIAAAQNYRAAMQRCRSCPRASPRCSRRRCSRR
jgi:hypothetical protein